MHLTSHIFKVTLVTNKDCLVGIPGVLQIPVAIRTFFPEVK